MTALWLAGAAAVAAIAFCLGWVAGRDAAERVAERTVADLRTALRRASRIDHADERRPE